jgi:hypothetical protein
MRPYLITAKLIRPSNMKRFPTPALDTSSQEGSGCSLLLCILRLCQLVFKMPLIENPSSVEVSVVIRFLNTKQKIANRNS